ncbi:MAG: hypothetical protein GF344_08900, partial [Chitinivibrionales bacterium]|nr:hypothetical protein [Chitinivibrionales bacterium]MBD3356976.1 hypothetical protein [Chitinivibrionales bacterium]
MNVFKQVLLYVMAAVGTASALHVELKEHSSSEPIDSILWVNIEYSCALWADRLGFDNCYLGDTVTVFLKMIKAKDYPSSAFMYAEPLRETFKGSRRLKSGSSATITFKDSAYVYVGEGHYRNEDAPWFIYPYPQFNSYWSHCDLFAKGLCDAEITAPKHFDFISHMGHEFGHVFGFVGRYLRFGQTGDSPDRFDGMDRDGNRFTFRFVGNNSHAATSMMALGFSAWQRAYPSKRELDACRIALGYEGTHIIERDSVVIGGKHTTTVSFDVADSFSVGTVEYTSSYADSAFGSNDGISVVLTSPAGTETDLGSLRMGWAKEGFVRPTNTSNRGSFNPPDTLSVYRGQSAKGVWTVRYVNESDEDVTVPGCCLRLTEAGMNAVRNKSRPARERSGAVVAPKKWRAFDVSGRLLASGKGNVLEIDA